VLINVNFPDCPPEQVKRIVVTAQGRRGPDRSQIDARQDGRGKPYYWITYRPRGAAKTSEDTDLTVLDEGCIAVTPLTVDMTDKRYIAKLGRMFG
jgi:5'-nucleotidase